MNLVSVVMPVYNAERWVAGAVESILAQTLPDLELVIVDDGSTDRSVDVVRSFGDARVRLLQNPGNQGVTASLNRGLDAATGVYVARMDADDVSLPDRLERQIAFLAEHPDVGVASAGVRTIEASPRTVVNIAADPDADACVLLFNSPLAHPTVVMRADVLRRSGLRYDEGYPHAEDYELWTRCADVTRIVSLPFVGLRYRRHAGAVGATHRVAQAATTNRIRRRELGRLGIAPTDAEAALHMDIATRRFRPEAAHLDAVEGWLLRLGVENGRLSRYPEPAFARRLATIWEAAGDFAVTHGVCARSRVLASPLVEGLDLAPVQRALLSRRRGRGGEPRP